MEKIFIIGFDTDKIHNIADTLVGKNDDLNIADQFISDDDNPLGYHQYYVDNDSITLNYQNNSLLFVTADPNREYVNWGITMDEFYNKDIFCIGYSDFLNIPEYIFRDENCLIVWIDGDFTDTNRADYYTEFVFGDIVSSIDVRYLYFTKTESSDDIAGIINEYILGTDARREEILSENS